MSIKERIEKIRAEIPSNVTLIAATKTREIDDIKQAIAAGITIIGENYVQEAETKYQELKCKAKLHLIGHLQTNKIKRALKIFDMIQTIDSLKLAEEINKSQKSKISENLEMSEKQSFSEHTPKSLILDNPKDFQSKAEESIDVLIEVNIGKEQNKTGVMPEKTIELIKEISKLNNIRIKGLMTMAPYFEYAEKTRPYFKEMKELFEKIKSLNIPNIKMKILSMGMSHSYKIAIEEGANMVRLGTIIFGKKGP